MDSHRLWPRLALCLVGSLLTFSGSSAKQVSKPPEVAAVRHAWIDAFSGWASPTTGQLFARVHRGTPPPEPVPGQSRYKRLKQTMEELELEAVGGATVWVQGIPGITSAVTDRNGFLVLKLPAGLHPGILDVTLTVAGWTSAPATLQVIVFDDSPGLGVISDIDDTLVDSGVTKKLELLKNTLFRSTWELKAFPLAAETVAALAGKGADGLPTVPLFYVSGSPWGLHSRISHFFDRAGFPHGAMILRRYSREPVRNPESFKFPHLKDIYEAFPHKSWILLGDSGERDPEVYARLSRDRTAAEYIRLVPPAKESDRRFAKAKVFRNWVEVQQDAAARHLDATPAPKGAT